MQSHAGMTRKASKCHAMNNAGVHLGISEPITQNIPGKWWKVPIFLIHPRSLRIAWLCLLVFTNCASQRDHPLGCQTDLRKKFRNTFKNIYKTLECFMLLSSYFFLRTLFRLNFSGSHGLFSGISSRTRCSIYQNCPSFSVWLASLKSRDADQTPSR